MEFRALLQYVTPHWRRLALMVALLVASGSVALANPWIAGKLVAALLEPGTGTLGLRAILLAWAALMVLRATLVFGTGYLIGITGETMSAQLRSRVYEHLQSLPLSYHQNRRPGDLLTLLANDARIISNFVASTVVQLLPQLFVFAGAILLMAWIDPLIAMAALLLLPLYFAAMKLVGRRIRPITSTWIRAWSGLVALVQENIGMLPAIKSFGREPLETARFGNQNRTVLGHSRRQVLAQSVLSPAVELMSGCGLLLLLWIGFSHVEAGLITAAELVSLILYAMLLTRPISGLANVYGQLMLTRGAAERLLEFFGERPEPAHRGGAVLVVRRGEIRYEDVCFRYAGRGPLLDHFDLTVVPGETIAVTGPNGSGKSTLIHLLLRFVAPSSGRILIDGTDIATVELASLRRQIGLVAQRTLLLNGSVADNLRYGVPLASEADLRRAAAMARADTFIEALPQGYDTVIGDQGVRLSGGQRQRLSLARTLLKDPPILVLDEATAMFDPEGEAEFIEHCRKLFRQRTVILITHRPASLALADRVIRLGIAADPDSVPTRSARVRVEA